MRTNLGELGIALSASYTTETAAVVSGGRRAGVDYAHQVTLEADVDWGKLAGLTGFSTHGVLVNLAGNNASPGLLGDRLLQVQSIYGGGGDVLVRFVELFGQQKLWDGRVDVKAGRIAVANDFAASPLYCQFVGLSLCGRPRALSADSGFTAWPAATWGGRVRFLPTAQTYLQLGLYEANARHGGRSGFNWSTTGSTGVAVPVEAGYELRAGGLLGHYKVGGILDTSRYPDLYSDSSGQPFAATGAAPALRRGRGSAYVLVDQMVHRTGPGATDGVFLLGAYIHSDHNTSTFQELAVAGLLAFGVVPGRPKDVPGLLFAYAKVNGRTALTQGIQAALGDPLANGATGAQSHEIVLEANYGAHVAEGVTITPDLQYVIRPGAARRYPDAVVLAVKTHVQF